MLIKILLQVHDAFGLGGFCFALYRERGNKDEINSSRSKTLKSIGLNHGDLIYLAPINGALLWPIDSPMNSHTSISPSGKNTNTSTCTGFDNSMYSTLVLDTFVAHLFLDNLILIVVKILCIRI